MTTERLYFGDPLLARFLATVVAHGRLPGHEQPTLILDRSAFYPESGGQMADRGTLGGAAIVDVQIDDALDVHHRIDGPLPAVGTTIEGAIDLPRRRAHMALHSAQHLLSRALADVASAETKSSRLGETACTIDVEVPQLAESALARAQALVLDVIDDDRPVRAWFPEASELASLPLRRAPKQATNIRVVDLGGFDVSPCGGTHVTRTAQIGFFRIDATERYKGGTRVTFTAGARARAEIHAEHAALGRAALLVSTPRTAVDVGIERLKERLKREQEQAGRLRAELARRIAESAQPDAARRTFVDVGELGIDLAKQVAAALTRRSATAIVRAATEGGAHLVLMRADGASVDCGALLRALASAANGKGGGRPEHAEGRLPLDFDVPRALEAL